MITFTKKEIKSQRYQVRDAAKLLSVLLPVREQVPERYAAAKAALVDAKGELMYMLASNEAAKAANNAADAIAAFAEVRADLCNGVPETVEAFYGEDDYSAAKAVILAYSAVKRLYQPQEKWTITVSHRKNGTPETVERSTLSLLDKGESEVFDLFEYKLGHIVSFVKDQIEDLRSQRRFRDLMDDTGNFYRAAVGGF